MTDELMHYGILGMHWGVRRYQNADGTLTESGKKRYQKLEKKRDTYQKKLDKQNAKFQKHSTKSNTWGKKYISEIGRGISENNYKKSVKDLRKAKKFEKRVDIANKKISRLDQVYIDKGNKFIKKVI